MVDLVGSFDLVFHFSFLSPFLWQTVRYKVKYSDLPSFEQFLVPNSRIFDKIS